MTSIWRDRTFELRQLLEILILESASETERLEARSKYMFLDTNIDLISPYPDAFFDRTGENPRVPQKSKFLRRIQDEFGQDGDMFILYGYPDLRAAGQPHDMRGPCHHGNISMG